MAKAQQKQQPTILFQAAYFVVLAAFFLASFVPSSRVWGFNWWAYFPIWVRLMLLATGIASGIAIVHRTGRVSSTHAAGDQTEASRWLIATLGTGLMLVISFILFRGQTHFLGDGYQLLSRLAGQATIVKSWDYGASQAFYNVYSLLSGEPQSRALLAFQIVSVLSGLLFLVMTAWLARLLFTQSLRRYLFFFGLAVAGYALMFFGYVENYAPFILAVLVYCLLGLAASRGKVSRWWTLLPLAIAIYFHIFGTLLLPSLLYLILHDTGPGKRLGSLPSSTKLLAALVVVIVGAVTYYLLYTHYYFFTFALLPLIPDRFTVEHDTLTSFKHIIDTVNLLVLLLPGLPVLLLALFSSPRGGVIRDSGYRFLAIAGLTILAAVYAFNPGIGMPRNWDLFSVVGVPLAVLAYAVILDENRPTRWQEPAAVFSIVLSLLSLGPRVASQVMPNIGIAHFKNYLTLDKIRNRNARSLLVDYYTVTGDTAKANLEQRHAEDDFPESVLNKQAKQLIAQGKFNDARRVLERAIQIDPIYPDAYGQMGVCFIQQGQIDTALTLFKIADGLNPYNPQTMNNVATAYLRKKDYPTAEREFLQSLAVDSTTLETLAGLASTYLALGQFERSIGFVSRLAARTDMTADYFRQAGDAYVSKGAYPQAAQAFGYALAHGLDSSYVRQVQQKYPELKMGI